MKLRRSDVAKIALGPKNAADLTFSAWERILAEIIVGDAFGADRIDFLLRDRRHAGLAAPRFNPFRLIAAARILPAPPSPANPSWAGRVEGETLEGDREEPVLGLLGSGLRSAEAMMRARHFMYSRLYLRHFTCIYDIHLTDFLKQWLPEGKYPTAVSEHLALTEREVTAAMVEAAHDVHAPGHDSASRFVNRDPFKLLYQRHPAARTQLQRGEAIYEAARKRFGAENVRRRCKIKEAGRLEFPVQTQEGCVVSSTAISEYLRSRPAASCDYVFVHPQLFEKARRWLAAQLGGTIEPRNEKERCEQAA